MYKITTSSIRREEGISKKSSSSRDYPDEPLRMKKTILGIMSARRKRQGSMAEDKKCESGVAANAEDSEPYLTTKAAGSAAAGPIIMQKTKNICKNSEEGKNMRTPTRPNLKVKDHGRGSGSKGSHRIIKASAVSEIKVTKKLIKKEEEIGGGA
jgi:hypothetical protein